MFTNLWGSLAGLTQVFGKKASPPPATTSPTSEAELDLTIEEESTSSTKDGDIDTDDLTLEQVPEEDKISSLTELTETKDTTSIKQELDSFLQESEKKSKSDSSES